MHTLSRRNVLAATAALPFAFSLARAADGGPRDQLVRKLAEILARQG